MIEGTDTQYEALALETVDLEVGEDDEIETLQFDPTIDRESNSDFCTVADAASYLGRSIRQVQRLVKAGQLEGHKIAGPKGPEWRVSRAGLEESCSSKQIAAHLLNVIKVLRNELDLKKQELDATKQELFALKSSQIDGEPTGILIDEQRNSQRLEPLTQSTDSQQASDETTLSETDSTDPKVSWWKRALTGLNVCL